MLKKQITAKASRDTPKGLTNADKVAGLQCHTAPHSWKLTFGSDLRLFEALLCACSAKEAAVWRQHLSERIETESKQSELSAQGSRSFLGLDIIPMGNFFGHVGSLARKLSSQRKGAKGRKSNLTQVIIRNTQSHRENPRQVSDAQSVNRSQSHLSSALTPVLAPKRVERIRLESALADVWTKDLLPFPGLGSKRAESGIRALPQYVSRKLSIASFSSSFSKRSSSSTSMSTLQTMETNGSSTYRIDRECKRATRLPSALGLQEQRRPESRGTCGTTLTGQATPRPATAVLRGLDSFEDFCLDPRKPIVRSRTDGAGAVVTQNPPVQRQQNHFGHSMSIRNSGSAKRRRVQQLSGEDHGLPSEREIGQETTAGAVEFKSVGSKDEVNGRTVGRDLMTRSKLSLKKLFS